MYLRTIFSAYRPDITGYTIVTSIETGVCGAVIGTGTGMIGISTDGGSVIDGIVLITDTTGTSAGIIDLSILEQKKSHFRSVSLS
jgi:hypothetical protein